MHDALFGIDAESAAIVFELMIEHNSKIESVIVNTLYPYDHNVYEDRKEIFADIAFTAVSAAVRNWNSNKCADFLRYLLYNVHFYARKWRTKNMLHDSRFWKFTDISSTISAASSKDVAEIADDALNTSQIVSNILDAQSLVSIYIQDSGITEFELYIVTYKVCYDMTFEDISDSLDFPVPTVKKYYYIGMQKLRDCAQPDIDEEYD